MQDGAGSRATLVQQASLAARLAIVEDTLTDDERAVILSAIEAVERRQ